MELLAGDLQQDKIRLSYLGSFDDEITEKLIGISEFYLANRSELGKLKNKVSFLIAECFQNIVRHGSAKDAPLNVPHGHNDFFQINVMDDRVILSSCNLVSDIHVESLKQKLIQVNSLNADELKKLYKDVLENQEFSEKGGAGLGLIEMARKSGLPLKYLFKKLGGEFDHFFLSLEISNQKETVDEKISITAVEKFYEHLLSEKIMLFYKGDLSNDIIIPIIDMLHHNFENKDQISGRKKRKVITTIEALQNVSKHAKSINGLKEGVFKLIKKEDFYIIEVGNYIEEGAHKEFEDLLISLEKMSLEEITALYKKRLIDTEIGPEGNCGLGLLEIARNSSKNYSYSFTPVSGTELFYSLKVTI